MLEINLLPWREQRRRVWRRVRIGLAFSGLAVLTISCFCYAKNISVNSIPPKMKPVTLTPQPELPPVKFIGYLQQGARVWGIVQLADGSTLDVHNGSNIPGSSAQVIQISATELVLKEQQQQVIIKMAGVA